MSNNLSVHFSSQEDSWETPQWLFDKLNEEFKFVLDVCASDANTKVKDCYYTTKDNALIQKWSGSCWMNPPYGRGIKDWIKHAYCSATPFSNTTVVALIPARTDTSYWHNYVAKSSEIRFLKGRLHFSNCATPAPFPSAIVVFKGNPVRQYPTVSHVDYHGKH